MTRQRTFSVNGDKIKIVSRLVDGGHSVNTCINRQKFRYNFEIMLPHPKGQKFDTDYYELFIQEAMDRSYVKWVKKNVNDDGSHKPGAIL